MTSTKTLERKIELVVMKLVREHLAEVESAACVAVRSGFASARQSTKTPSQRRGAGTRKRKTQRSRAELARLADLLYEAVCEHPGETMTVLAPIVGKSVGELNRPSRTLRATHRVRTVGVRRHTRYFPIGA